MLAWWKRNRGLISLLDFYKSLIVRAILNKILNPTRFHWETVFLQHLFCSSRICVLGVPTRIAFSFVFHKVLIETFTVGLHLIHEALLQYLIQSITHFSELEVGTSLRVREALFRGIGYNGYAMTQTGLQHGKFKQS